MATANSPTFEGIPTECRLDIYRHLGIGVYSVDLTVTRTSSPIDKKPSLLLSSFQTDGQGPVQASLHAFAALVRTNTALKAEVEDEFYANVTINLRKLGPPAMIDLSREPLSIPRGKYPPSWYYFRERFIRNSRTGKLPPVQKPLLSVPPTRRLVMHKHNVMEGPRAWKSPGSKGTRQFKLAFVLFAGADGIINDFRVTLRDVGGVRRTYTGCCSRAMKQSGHVGGPFRGNPEGFADCFTMNVAPFVVGARLDDKVIRTMLLLEKALDEELIYDGKKVFLEAKYDEEPRSVVAFLEKFACVKFLNLY